MRSTGQVFCFMPYSWNLFHAFFSIKLRLWFVERKITEIKCHSFVLWKVHYIKMTYHCWSPGWGRVFSGFFLKKICKSVRQSSYINYLRFFYMKELPIPHHSFINSIIYLCHFWTDVILLCCCLVAKLCLTFCNTKDCSIPGFPVLYHHPVFSSHSCPLSQGCLSNISSSVAHFACLSYHESFPVSQFFASGGPHIGASASALILPMNI